MDGRQYPLPDGPVDPSLGDAPVIVHACRSPGADIRDLGRLLLPPQ
jgi:hypothetical protein